MVRPPRRRDPQNVLLVINGVLASVGTLSEGGFRYFSGRRTVKVVRPGWLVASTVPS